MRLQVCFRHVGRGCAHDARCVGLQRFFQIEQLAMRFFTIRAPRGLAVRWSRNGLCTRISRRAQVINELRMKPQKAGLRAQMRPRIVKQRNNAMVRDIASTCTKELHV